ncbi:hypothetical protein HDU84_000405 [Entophlyctis sp. JEL0112]|nr:hypothetical protein HDU84_000405 [Entophlyctis sp. JEL0112]
MNGSDVFAVDVGESEEKIRAKFTEAAKLAESSARSCILFIDEIDAIAPNRDESSRTDSRMVATLLTLMDGMSALSRFVVIAATNRPNALDPALRRPGRFDREVAIDPPSETVRLRILESIAARGMTLKDDVDFGAISVATNGYVGADLAALCREAAISSLEHGRDTVAQADFIHGLSLTTPSTTRGYSFSLQPSANLTWSSVGGLEDVKLKLQQSVDWPLTRRDVFLRLGLTPPRGVLLYGPPGCSKTTLVKVIASESNATFFSVNGASLYSPFVGESEAALRTVFHRARISAPSVIFIDEIDALVGSRDLTGGDSGSRDATQENVLSTLLNEMDGIENAKNVLGATNRPDMVDSALMRPGRFDKVIYVPPPDSAGRRKILDIHSKGMPISSSVDFDLLVVRTERYTGADLESLCREAAFAALRESKGAGEIQMRHFEDALLDSVKPSLSSEMISQYALFRAKFDFETAPWIFSASTQALFPTSSPVFRHSTALAVTLFVLVGGHKELGKYTPCCDTKLCQGCYLTKYKFQRREISSAKSRRTIKRDEKPEKPNRLSTATAGSGGDDDETEADSAATCPVCRAVLVSALSASASGSWWSLRGGSKKVAASASASKGSVATLEDASARDSIVGSTANDKSGRARVWEWPFKAK